MQLIHNIEEKYEEILNTDSTLDCFVIERVNLTKSTCDLICNTAHGHHVVYFLVNLNEARNTKRNIYVGETTNVYIRMIDHNRKKKWWTHAIIFTGDKRKVDESCVMALENLLIQKVKACGLYEYSNLQESKKDTDKDYDTKFNYILNIMDLLGYPLDEEEKTASVVDENKEEKDKALYDEIFDSLIGEFGDIKFEQQKLYKSFYTFVKNKKVMLFALWPNLEAELYLPYEKALSVCGDVYDVSNRLRGNRQSALKIKNKNDITSLLSLAKVILKQ